jgi:2,4-dienoyl-CoA reductase-like NADH-dependent reductase (Old Yellow Enzyme family)
MSRPPDVAWAGWLTLGHGRFGEPENGFGIISTGNIDIEYDHLDAIADMVIAPESEFEGERFEGFKALAAAAKAKGSLVLGQVTHPGRQVQSKINKHPISASDVQLGRSISLGLLGSGWRIC